MRAPIRMKNRIEYFDALRGVMMLLVVYSHVLYHGLGAGMPTPPQSWLNDIFITFRMPLFFFISGFFLYSPDYTASLLRRRSANRLLKQLYPTVVLAVVFCLVCKHRSMQRLLFHEQKYGYWFTLTAVEMFFLMAPMLAAMSWRRLRRMGRSRLIIAYAVVIETLAVVAFNMAPAKINGLIGLRYLYLYFPYVAVGVLFRANYERILPYIMHPLTAIGCLAIYIAAYFAMNFPDNRFILGFAAIIVIHYVVCRLFEVRRISGSAIVKGLKYVGTLTLEIYLMHYFLIHLIGLAHQTGRLSWLDGFVGGAVEFPLIMVIVIGVVLVCIGAVRILKALRAYRLLFPRTWRIVRAPSAVG